MHLSDRIQRIADSATMAVTQAARDLRAQGRDVISLSVGEPDFAPPQHILDAASQAMAEGHTGYTAADGIPALKDAIIAKFARDNALSFSRSEISVAPGGKAVLWNALAVTVGPGDEVIIPTPCWVSYPDMVRMTGATPILVKGGPDFKITPEALSDAVTRNTRWLILNSPGNPTGAVYCAAELEALAEVLRAHPEIMVLSDDIYEHLVYGDADFATLAQVAPDLAERVLTMNGVSKAYAMTGFRIGYAGGPEWLIAAMRKFIGQTTSCPAAPSQWAAVAALNGDHGFLTEWRQTYRARGIALRTSLEKTGLRGAQPDGAFYLFLDCQEAMARAGFRTDSDLAMAILQEAGVATVPGSAFHAPGYLRLSYAASMESLMSAADRITDYLASD
ncbi:pyridoxal phosphate-dependent aminotransferase [Algimonas porphyrae]|uniref:Aminotransferase n=1 Tax=Algimonas porphyrae TaxID=1128113 RepID=A0ABQ5V2X2_9PROT|nr:pyridoxal phosphate-dependent aminotransferase [Algimonas porphyrae]GLQ21823.1 aminotransferase [Algimonas porphyrae]